MTDIADLPEDLRNALRGKAVLLFDGTCLLCMRYFQFILRHDRADRFSFATAQSELGGALYHALGLPVTDFETYIVIVDGRIYTKTQAFGAAMGVLGGLWRPLSLIKYVPGWLTDPVYGVVARNRYRIFGRSETCFVPDAALRSRFLT